MTAFRKFAAGILASLCVASAANAAGASSVDSSVTAEVKRYCSNIADPAADARYALQAKELKDLRDQIDGKIKLLETKQAEYQGWVQQRDQFMKMADDKLVQIIANMRPDTAATQLALVGDAPAAAILMKLNPRVASPILNEMAPEKAAALQRIMVGAGMADAGGKTQ